LPADEKGVPLGAPYVPPVLVQLGSVHELTLGCNKDNGVSDGYYYQGIPIMCTSA